MPECRIKQCSSHECCVTSVYCYSFLLKEMKLFRIFEIYVLVLFLGMKHIATASSILQNCSHICLISRCLCCEILMNLC